MTAKKEVAKDTPKVISYKGLVTEFLLYTDIEVFKTFGALEGAKIIKEKGKDSKDIYGIYIPGKLPPERRVLLVAHADTARRVVKPPKIRWIGDVCCQLESEPLGGDDRCGCAMLMALSDSGHSLLVTNEEESGCVGSRAILECEPAANMLKEHCFAIQIDRRGDRQLVYYDVATTEFEKYVKELFDKHDHEGYAWTKQVGSNTDIRVLCPKLGFCGVNLSAGYLNEHMSSEMVLMGAWMNTFLALKGFLTEEHRSFPFTPRASYVVPLDNRVEWDEEYGEGGWRGIGYHAGVADRRGGSRLPLHGAGGHNHGHNYGGPSNAVAGIVKGRNTEENWEFTVVRVSGRMMKKWLRASNYSSPQCNWCRTVWPNGRKLTHTGDIADEMTNIGWRVVFDGFGKNNSKSIIRLICFNCASLAKYAKPPSKDSISYVVCCEYASCKKTTTQVAETIGQARTRVIQSQRWKYVYDTLLCDECYAKWVANPKLHINSATATSWPKRIEIDPAEKLQIKEEESLENDAWGI